MCLVQGGPGKLLFRKFVSVSGVYHIITAREFGKRGLLRLRLYEPVSAVEREIRLSQSMSRMCGGGCERASTLTVLCV